MDTSTESPPPYSKEEMMSALFAQMVMQQTNMAMMLLGKAAHPETGERVRDLDSARLFIDQLEMLEVKTNGNLSKEEATLLKQALMSLRMAFVEAAEDEPPAAAQPDPSARPADPAKASEPAKTATGSPPSGEEEEHRKKFTKKY